MIVILAADHRSQASAGNPGSGVRIEVFIDPRNDLTIFALQAMAPCVDFQGLKVVGFANGTDSLNFPTTDGAIQQTFKGGYGDAFVAKLSADGSSLLFSTYLGSTGPDHAFPGLCLHSDGSIIVTGVAGAADFPTTPGAYQPVFAGTEISGVWYGDTFVARFSLTPAHEHVLHYITFLGGSGTEKSTAQHGIALDKDGNAVIAVTTHSTDFPTTAAAYQKTLKGNNNICISKLSLDGTQLLGSTYFGGSADNGYEPSGLCLDAWANVFVTGSIFGNIANHPITTDAFGRTSGGQDEAFFAVLSPDLSRLRYSSHFGGLGNDRIRDLARSKSGDLVFAGDTYSANLPVSQGVFQEDYHGAGDAYVARFSPSRLPPGDVRDDDVVNFLDVLAMADMWLALANPETDLTGDRRTDLRDYSVIAKNWRLCYGPSGPAR